METEPMELMCLDCSWTGTVEELVQRYRVVAKLPYNDVEPCHACPNCGGENLDEIGKEVGKINGECCKDWVR